MLSDEVREKIVLALTGTTREQCRGALTTNGEDRCAMGVLCDVYKVNLRPLFDGYIRDMCPEREQMNREISLKLEGFLMHANDRGATFDEIAKLVKEWEG